MSRMAMEFFARSPVLALPIIALLIFASVFVVIVVRAMRMPHLAIESDARLPLREDTDV
jgi:hypothetical protein